MQATQPIHRMVDTRDKAGEHYGMGKQHHSSGKSSNKGEFSHSLGKPYGTKPKLALITSHGRILIGTQKGRGGFVKEGLDAGGYHLMETQAGLNALKIFTQMGRLKPLYLSQAFFDKQQPGDL